MKSDHSHFKDAISSTKVNMFRYARRLASYGTTIQIPQKRYNPRRPSMRTIQVWSRHTSTIPFSDRDIRQSHNIPDLKLKVGWGRVWCSSQSSQLHGTVFYQRQQARARYSSSNGSCSSTTVQSKTISATSCNIEDKDKSDMTINIPGSQTGGKKLAIIFTCTVCDTRSAKQFTENAYQKGVVIVTCPGCQNKHLIADNLGFFEDREDGGWNIEKAMEKMGQPVTLVTDDNVMEVVSVEDGVSGHLVTQKATQESHSSSNDDDDDIVVAVRPNNPVASNDETQRKNAPTIE
jgi:mitochondrial protein import protein ZIM17